MVKSVIRTSSSVCRSRTVKSKRIKQTRRFHREAGDIENTQRTQIKKDDQADG